MPYISRINAVHIGGTNLSQMTSLERINAASNNRQMKFAVVTAQAERALTELGLKSEKVTRIMAGAAKLSPKDIDNAMRAKAQEYANEVNERTLIAKSERSMRRNSSRSKRQ